MAEACPRCGHDRVHELKKSDRMKKLLPGFKPERVTCGTDTGTWACPCRSRFHVGVSVSRTG